jgi:hypothetical protein
LESAEKTCKILQVTRMKCLLIIIKISWNVFPIVNSYKKYK